MLTVALLVVAFLLVRQHSVRNSEQLERAISNELPLGSSEAQVVAFIEKRHPLFCDDLGSEIKTRLSGLARNMIYRKDVILMFEFDPAGELLFHSKKEYLTFL